MQIQLFNLPFTALLLCAALLTGCSRNNDPTPDGPAPVAVNFTSSLDGAVPPSAQAARTRTTAGGDEWVQNDKVGIFMVTAGRSLQAGLAKNICYLATPSVEQARKASFKPQDASQTIFYPQSGNVDFVAYYPWADNDGRVWGRVDENGNYNIAVIDQSNPQAIDVLYAKTSNVPTGQKTVELSFKHVLSKITLHVKAGTGFQPSDLSKVTMYLMNMLATARLDLNVGLLAPDFYSIISPVKAASAAEGSDATFSAILIPQAAGATDREAYFFVGGQTYVWTIPDTQAFEPGRHYTFPITINRTGMTVGAPTITPWKVDNSNPGKLETPRENTVLIPPGTFTMGQTGISNAVPVHQVTLTKEFYMSKHQVTTTQYAAFLNAKGIGEDRKGTVTYYKDNFTTPVTEQKVEFVYAPYGITWNSITGQWIPVEKYKNHPMGNVSWYGAKAYADWVKGALPTEAQWEYACRAGTPTSYYFGDDSNIFGEYGWYKDNSGGDYPQAVGQKLPNAYGLYDMYGNVYEWCSDWYDANYYKDASAGIDPRGPATGTNRVLRGGYYGTPYTTSAFIGSACRYSMSSTDTDRSNGFRVVFP